MPEKATLTLTLHRQWFADIAAGTKRTEYRERKPYWKIRLEGRHYDTIRLRIGYAKNAPEMVVECLGIHCRDRDYAIRLGRIISIKRWRSERG